MARGWHGQDFHFSVAFGDGRAEFLHMKGVFCEDVVGFSGTGCYGQVTGENGAVMRIISRSRRWQLDTLPSECIRTPIASPGWKSAEPDGEPRMGVADGM